MLVFLNYAAVLPLIQREWGLSNSSAGPIFSAYQAGYILSATLLSYLTDRIRARTIFLTSAIWSVVANVLFALFATDLSSAIMLRALAGLGMGGTYMPGLKLVADQFPSEQRGRAVGYFTSAFVFGAAASTFLSGLIASVAGWRAAIFTTAMGTLVGLLLSLPLLLEDRGVRGVSAADATRRVRLDVVRNKPALLMIVAYASHMWEQYGMRAPPGPASGYCVPPALRSRSSAPSASGRVLAWESRVTAGGPPASGPTRPLTWSAGAVSRLAPGFPRATHGHVGG